MDNQNIETIPNSLAEGYKQLVSGTFQEASQIQIQRRADRILRNTGLYTANLPLFRMNGKDLEYGLGGRQAFDAIAGENIDGFAQQILQKGVYGLTAPQIGKLESLAEDIVWARAENLNLNKETDEWSSFFIYTQDTAADKLTATQKSIAAKVYGSMEAKSFPEQELSDYGETMNMLDKTGGIRQTRLWLPTPAYIKDYLAVDWGIVVARAAELCSFGGDSNFGAGIRFVGGHGVLRGVRRASISEPAVPAVPAGDGPKNTSAPSAPSEITCAEHYDALLTNPKRALSALNNKRAEGIAKLLADYLAAQAQ